MKDGAPFIDRDPEIFQKVIEFLQDEKFIVIELKIRKQMEEEFEFWGINFRQIQVLRVFQQEPTGAYENELVLAVWKRIGPFVPKGEIEEFYNPSSQNKESTKESQAQGSSLNVGVNEESHQIYSGQMTKYREHRGFGRLQNQKGIF